MSLISSGRIYRWLRLLHLYGGLFVSPLLVVFAISAILINHPSLQSSPAEPTRRQVSIDVPGGLKGLDLAKEVMRQTGVTGEIDFFSEQAQGPRISVPVSRPSVKITITADLAAKTANISTRAATFGERMIYLHKYPGPHVANIRGNWVFTRAWGVLADGTVYLLLFVTVTGIYIWYIVKSERKRGLVFLGAGCVAFVVVLLALMR